MRGRSELQNVVEVTSVRLKEQDASNEERNLSAQSLATRGRRRKIKEKTQELRKLIPDGYKMNTAEMLQAAFMYITGPSRGFWRPCANSTVVEVTSVRLKEQDASNEERNLSAQSLATRGRRRKIKEKTQELRKLIPDGYKMNTAEMLQAAFMYITGPSRGFWRPCANSTVRQDLRCMST
uniref:Myc-type, basic helix-loop-helix (BHLH) domain-containing protein n=1 Tax=Tanacetum cinerariifolium TaxID=118510 RepID=A0A699GPD8_TANCI|nr:Myc-type, basic helix-loop-helix (bHLH) domain-containing protein [Tanacetum cinerariifolium]